MQKKKICLTGIKPTGELHLGNYFGAIEKALKCQGIYENRFFIADYHALNSLENHKNLKENVQNIAAAWLACGLDPEKTIFFRQSSISQIAELTIILMCFTSKGWMNRAHAYKAIVSENEKNRADVDRGVNMGLFNYPIMMAADILMFQSDVVPVGKDQLQHLEIANYIAQHFNSITKSGFFHLAEPLADEKDCFIVGTDGRKMSKSYHNTIPLFASNKEIRKKVMKIPTNSQGIEEVKDPRQCNIFSLYEKIAEKSDVDALATRYQQGGMSWGEAKEILAEAIVKKFAPMHQKYREWLANETLLNSILLEGEKKAQEIANNNLKEIKKIIGIR